MGVQTVLKIGGCSAIIPKCTVGGICSTCTNSQQTTINCNDPPSYYVNGYCQGDNCCCGTSVNCNTSGYNDCYANCNYNDCIGTLTTVSDTVSICSAYIVCTPVETCES